MDRESCTEVNSMFTAEKKHETSTISCCAELSINSGIRRFEATPTSEQRHQAPGAGKPEETRNQEPGRNQKGVGETQSNSRACHVSQIFLRT